MGKDTTMEFCRRVTAQVRHATPEEKQSIEAELAGHMEDRAEVLRECGYTEEEAAERALQAMGDAEEIGRRLNREYPLHWLVLSRVTVIATALICMTLIFTWPILGFTLESLEARLWPQRLSSQTELGKYSYEVDVRADVGSDVLRVYRVDLWKNVDGTGQAEVSMCNYDRSVFGVASNQIYANVTVVTAQGTERAHGGGGSSMGRAYRTIELIEIPVSTEETELCIVYQAYGERAVLRVPLKWEVLA